MPLWIPDERDHVVAGLLTALVKGWGGSVEMVPQMTLEGFEGDETFSMSPAADGMGVFYGDRRVIHDGRAHWADLIHEAGHVFACPEVPSASQEFDFFGFEYAVARKLHAPLDRWHDRLGSYQVDAVPGVDSGRYSSWDKLKWKQREAHIRERIWKARLLGIISKKGLEPTPIR